MNFERSFVLKAGLPALCLLVGLAAIPFAQAAPTPMLIKCDQPACNVQCESVVCDILDILCNWEGTGLGAGVSPVIVNTRDLAIGLADNLLAVPGSYAGYSGIQLFCA